MDVTCFVAGSMRDTVPSPELATHTAPAPATTETGREPTPKRSVIPRERVANWTTSSPALFTIHRVRPSGSAASAAGVKPRGSAGSGVVRPIVRRVRLRSSPFATQTTSSMTVTATGSAPVLIGSTPGAFPPVLASSSIIRSACASSTHRKPPPAVSAPGRKSSRTLDRGSGPSWAASSFDRVSPVAFVTQTRPSGLPSSPRCTMDVTPAGPAPTPIPSFSCVVVSIQVTESASKRTIQIAVSSATAPLGTSSSAVTSVARLVVGSMVATPLPLTTGALLPPSRSW